MTKRGTKSKKEWLAEEVAKAVNAGKPVAMETVDFSDPHRPPTCLEVDFPILPINQVAAIEGNAGKPIYQMSKWWARRRSSVFRSMLIAAATKAPADRAEAARLVWSNYYCNHQKQGAFKHLKVADIFMGGGTTIVEGSRLGMQMYGVDLNPVAWFVVKNEMAKVDRDEVQKLLDAIEADVKPKIMPFYACDCPAGHKGTWYRKEAGDWRPEAEGFDPLSVPRDKRHEYRYEGPEIIYVFWAKHGPCSVTGCGHRTPIMSSPVIAVKTLTVKAWVRRCGMCHEEFDMEDREARMAPGEAIVLAESERPFAVATMDLAGEKPASVECPHCGKSENVGKVGKGKSKKIELTLLIHPAWLRGESGTDKGGKAYGGSMTDGPEETAAWNRARAKKCRFVEVRGPLPAEVTCPETKVTFRTGEDRGTVPKKSNFACGSCGRVQDVLTSVKASGKTGPVAAYAIQGYCPECDRKGTAYGGRFFAPVNETAGYDGGVREWQSLKDGVLSDFWPRSELPFGFMTHKLNGGIPNHGFTHWWTMFNPRQRIVQAELLRAIVRAGTAEWPVREFVLGAFQQFLRNQNMFSFWHLQLDKLAPAMSNSNFHPKSTVVEVGVFPPMGYGPWTSTIKVIEKACDWLADPTDAASTAFLRGAVSSLDGEMSGKSEKVAPGDPPLAEATLLAGSATALTDHLTAQYDLVITDPPFGGLLHYSELSDFFYVWLRLVLKERYSAEFGPEYTPKTLEVVANRARQPEDPDGYYQRLLTASWVEAGRILKPGGMLAFTFHHSEDAPWVQVLESLFDGGFYLEATYPIRGDETKGQGEFGSRKVEYDIIHVCRKRTEEPTAVSWAKMRREVIRDVRQIQELLEAHTAEGLPAADVQVIRRGKALEYFSRHYGKVYVEEGKTITVLEALAGVNQLLDEESGGTQDPPPVTAEPFTRQFLRLFDGIDSMDRNDLQKFLRGTGIAPSEFEARGWCAEREKAFHVTPLLEIARGWIGKKQLEFFTVEEG